MQLPQALVLATGDEVIAQDQSFLGVGDPQRRLEQLAEALVVSPLWEAIRPAIAVVRSGPTPILCVFGRHNHCFFHESLIAPIK